MSKLPELPVPEVNVDITAADRFDVLIATPKGAATLLNCILDEFGAVDLLNCFFLNLAEADQQQLIDKAHYRIFAEQQHRPKVLDEYEYKGQKKTLREWCVIAKLPEDTVAKRLMRGWSIERALEKPIIHAKIRPGTCGF